MIITQTTAARVTHIPILAIVVNLIFALVTYRVISPTNGTYLLVLIHINFDFYFCYSPSLTFRPPLRAFLYPFQTFLAMGLVVLPLVGKFPLPVTLIITFLHTSSSSSSSVLLHQPNSLAASLSPTHSPHRQMGQS